MNDNTRNVFLATALYCVAPMVRAIVSPMDWFMRNPHYIGLNLTNHGTLTDIMLPIHGTRRSLWYGGMQTHMLYTQFGSLISLGTGYRHLMGPQWLMGGHLYWDGAKLSHQLGFYSQLNPGVEVQSILGGVTLNAYLPIMMPGAEPSQLRHHTRRYYQHHQERETQYIDPNHWAIDGRLSFILFSKLTGFIGGYYMPQTTDWAHHRDASHPLHATLQAQKESTVNQEASHEAEAVLERKSFDILGGAVGAEYAINPMLTINMKYSFDAFRRHYMTVGFRFEHNTHQMRRMAPKQLLWQPANRHIAPISINKEQVIKDNIYFLKVERPIEGANKANVGKGTYEHPASLNNNTSALNALTEKTKTKNAKIPITFYIANGLDENDKTLTRIPGNINATVLYEHQSIYGRNSDFEPLKSTQLDLRPILAGVLRLPEGNNSVSDLTFCPDLSGHYRYHIKGDNVEQQETSIAIGNQEKGSRIENIVIQNVDMMDVLNAQTSETSILSLHGPKPNGLKSLTSTLCYDTGIEVIGANRIMLNNVAIDFAKIGLAIESVNDMAIYNSAIGTKGTKSVMTGLWTKKAREIKVENSVMEGSEQALRTTEGSEVSVYCSTQRMRSDAQKIAAPMYITDSSVSVMGNNKKNSTLYVSAKNAIQIAPAVIGSTMSKDQQHDPHYETSLQISYTAIKYVMDERFRDIDPQLLRLANFTPVKKISFTDSVFHYPRGHKLADLKQGEPGQEDWMTVNTMDRSYSVNNKRRRSVRPRLQRKRSGVLKSPKVTSPNSPKQNRRTPRGTPISPKLPVFPDVTNIEWLFKVVSVMREQKWNQLSQAEKNDAIFNLLPFSAQKKAIDKSALNADQKLAAHYYLIFKRRGRPIPTDEHAKFIRDRFLSDHFENNEFKPGEIALKYIMYGPETSDEKWAFIQSLKFPKKAKGETSFDSDVYAECTNFENYTKRVKELEKDKPAEIAIDTLLARLNLEQFNLDKRINEEHTKKELDKLDAIKKAAAIPPARKVIPLPLQSGVLPKEEVPPVPTVKEDLKGLAIDTTMKTSPPPKEVPLAPVKKEKPMVPALARLPTSEAINRVPNQIHGLPRGTLALWGDELGAGPVVRRDRSDLKDLAIAESQEKLPPTAKQRHVPKVMPVDKEYGLRPRGPLEFEFKGVGLPPHPKAKLKPLGRFPVNPSQPRSTRIDMPPESEFPGIQLSPKELAAKLENLPPAFKSALQKMDKGQEDQLTEDERRAFQKGMTNREYDALVKRMSYGLDDSKHPKKLPRSRMSELQGSSAIATDDSSIPTNDSELGQVGQSRQMVPLNDGKDPPYPLSPSDEGQVPTSSRKQEKKQGNPGNAPYPEGPDDFLNINNQRKRD